MTLPLKEFELLHVLLANAGRALPRDTLIDRVWGSDYVGDTKTLDVHVKRLRVEDRARPGQPDPHRHDPRPRLQVRTGLTFGRATLVVLGPILCLTLSADVDVDEQHHADDHGDQHDQHHDLGHGTSSLLGTPLPLRRVTVR